MQQFNVYCITLECIKFLLTDSKYKPNVHKAISTI